MLDINTFKMRFKHIYILWSLLGCLTVMSCAKDNYDQPNASIHGILKNAKTGEAVPGVVGNGNFGDLQFFQLDYGVTNPAAFTIAGFKEDGTYSNNTIFNGQYKLVPRGPYFYQDTLVVDLAGKMNVDLSVIPYINVKIDVSEVTSTSITVKVKAQRNAAADEIVNQQISQVLAVLGTTAGVNYNNYYVVNNNTTDYRQIVTTSTIANAEIGLTDYSFTFSNLKANTAYYLRGAARVSNNNPSNYYNYSNLLEVKTIN